MAVVGAGAAGLYAALVAARAGARVALVSRSPLAESASYWAQGGIAAALGADDSPERHAQDTLSAGRAMANAGAARVSHRILQSLITPIEQSRTYRSESATEKRLM